jgi:uncharacterized protein (UPF0335 family)
MSEIIGRNSLSGELLRGFVERCEAINEQMEALRADKRVVMAEARQQNLQPAGVNYIVKKRKMKPSERAEAEALEDMYLHAMGMAVDNPLFRAVGLMKIDVTARDQVIEAMKKFVPASGSITIEAGGAPVRLTRDPDGNISVTEVIEKPVEAPAPSAKKAAPPTKTPVPNVDVASAEALGRQAFRSDQPIIANPFPFNDPRRPRWDYGWRDESGGDGMGPDED